MYDVGTRSSFSGKYTLTHIHTHTHTHTYFPRGGGGEITLKSLAAENVDNIHICDSYSTAYKKMCVQSECVCVHMRVLLCVFMWEIAIVKENNYEILFGAKPVIVLKI